MHKGYSSSPLGPIVKKTAIFAASFIVSILIPPAITFPGLVSCAGAPIPARNVQCRESIAEMEIARAEGGWCGDDAFRWKETGAPLQTLNDREKRKEAAMKAAVENARHAILDHFKGYSIEGAGDYFWENEPDLPRRRGLQKDLTSAVQSGKVIAAACDTNETCIILYEVTRKGLKKLVSETSWR